MGTLPAHRIKNSLLRSLGHQIGRSAVVGPGLFIKIGRISVGEHTRIGPFNVFRGLTSVQLDDFARIGQWNWISASGDLVRAGGKGSLSIGEHSALTARHYLDCSGGISIGRFTTVAGVRSTFITHGIDWRTAQQRTRSIHVGDYCIISSNTAVAPGTIVGDRLVTGMGATLSGQLDENGALYLSPRAEAVKAGLTGTYFERDEGYVHPAPQARPEEN